MVAFKALEGISIIQHETFFVSFSLLRGFGIMNPSTTGGHENMNTDKIYAEQIANEYAPKDTSKVIALRKLDAKAKRPAEIFTYSFGIAATLVVGVGMCLSMKVIGNGSTFMFILGIIIGIIGFVGVGVNYPIYKKILAKGKQKYAFEIMQLAKEISEKEK